MGRLLNSNELGVHGFKRLDEQRREIIDKWAESGLLDGFRFSGAKKVNIAQLLESEAQWMINGRSMSDTDYLKERYTDSLAVKDLVAASRYLEKLISVMSFEIKKKHC